MAKKGRPKQTQVQVKAEERINRAIKALEIKRNFDLTYEQIGKQLGITASMAYNDVMFLLRKKITDNAESIEEMRQIENERLGLLWSRWLPRALGNKSEGIAPDLSAARFCETLIRRRCEINGLNMPVKVAITDKEGKHDLVGLTLQDARRRIEAILAESGDIEDSNGQHRIPQNLPK